MLGLDVIDAAIRSPFFADSVLYRSPWSALIKNAGCQVLSGEDKSAMLEQC